MAVRTTRVNVNRSAIITEGGAFQPENGAQGGDYSRSAVFPILPYEGENFLPTYYGYKSYFGLDSKLDASGLPAGVVVEQVFVYQARNYQNVLVALTEVGIFLRIEADKAWVHAVVLPAPPAGQGFQWTMASINQLHFMYRAGGTNVYVFEDIVDGAGINMDKFNGKAVQPTRADAIPVGFPIQVFEFQPTTLNMDAQVGLFKASGSLGFWDTDDAIAWSAMNDYTDFEPNLQTLANISKLSDQIGRITVVKPHGQGFVVYCTQSILFLRENLNGLLRYESTVVTGQVGVAYPREVTVTQPDSTHFAYTSIGLMQIQNGKAEPIIPDLSDQLQATRNPAYLKMINQRYLAIQVLDPNFITGRMEQSAITTEPTNWEYAGSESGGSFAEGVFLEGATVCLSTKEPVQVDTAVKPYYVLPLYEQHRYRGTTIDILNGQLENNSGGASDVTLYRLTEGTTDTAYRDDPIEMDGDEVAGYEQQIIDQLVARQWDEYLSAYDPTLLDIQAAFDQYNNGDIRVNQRTITVSNFTYNMTQHLFPYQTVAGNFSSGYTRTVETHGLSLISSDANIESYAAFLQDSNGRGYVSSKNSSASSVVPISNQEFIDNGLQAAVLDWAGKDMHVTTDGSVIEEATVLQSVGDMTTTYYNNNIKTGSEGGTVVFNPLADSFDQTSREAAAVLQTSPDYYVLHPSFMQEQVIQAADPSRPLAYKVLDNQSPAIRIRLEQLSNETRVVRQIPRALEYQVNGFDAYRIDDPFDVYPPNTWAVPYDAFRGVADDAEGNTVALTSIYSAKGNRIFYPGNTFSVSVSANLDASAARIEYRNQLDQHASSINATIQGLINTEYNTAYQSAMSQAQSAMDALAADPESNYNDYTNHRIQRAGSDIPPEYSGTESWPERHVQADDQTIYNLRQDTYVSVTWCYKRLTFETTTEALEDIRPKLFGEVPTDLSTLSADALRGIIATHSWFYSNNNSKEELDASFLLPEAGKVEVPLGSDKQQADADPINFTQQADNANRYAIFEDQYPANNTQQLGPMEVLDGQLYTKRVVCGTSLDINVPDIFADPIYFAPWEIENPPATWVLENGSIAPLNPTMYGAYVFDTHLQRWGIMKAPYKQLIDYKPVNNYTPGAISYEQFMIDGGCLGEDLSVSLFNSKPANSFIRYGKYQHISADRTRIEEVELKFNNKSNGYVVVNASLDGRHIEYAHSVAGKFTDDLSTVLNCSIVGQWTTVTVMGEYDLSGMTIRSHGVGER